MCDNVKPYGVRGYNLIFHGGRGVTEGKVKKTPIISTPNTDNHYDLHGALNRPKLRTFISSIKYYLNKSQNT